MCLSLRCARQPSSITNGQSYCRPRTPIDAAGENKIRALEPRQLLHKGVRWSERRQHLQQVRSVWPVADYVSLVFTTPRPESARNPIDCLCGVGRRAFETTPAGVNLSLARPMAPRPRFSGGRAVPRHIIANDGAGCPKKYSWLLTGFGLRD